MGGYFKSTGCQKVPVPKRSRKRTAAASLGGVPALPHAGRWQHAFEELTQNGVRRETVPDPSGGARRTLCALRNSRKTERGAKPFLVRLEVGAAPFALLLRNSRKTECGAKQFLVRLEVRAAPFAFLRSLIWESRPSAAGFSV